MSVKDTIKARAGEVFGDGSPTIYKSLDYDGARQAMGRIGPTTRKEKL